MSISSTSSNITKSSSSIEIYQGESKDLDLEIVQEVQQPDETFIEQAVDLTGAKICFTVRKRLGEIDTLIAKDSTNAIDIEIVAPPEDGMAIIHLLSEDTSLLDPGSYIFDVWVTLSSGKKLIVIEPSEFIVKEPVTKGC